MSANLWEMRAQRRKARAMARWMWRRLTPAQRRAGVAEAMQGLPLERRLELAKASGQHPDSRAENEPPSDQTWEWLVAWVDDHSRALRGRVA